MEFFITSFTVLSQKTPLLFEITLSTYTAQDLPLFPMWDDSFLCPSHHSLFGLEARTLPQ
ncbi:hypothetical protein AXF42_Ash015997 [Apostasia shenzhenica]|uniref:Uncharacterized protein n=1 Tax=Apostasia shenzhenica TaxID=1088818 RepID=A0A2I0AWN3_9ASPA|nr:hypothetical protein AXF42_Ash015997 [Apostasia shenzhenica]